MQEYAHNSCERHAGKFHRKILERELQGRPAYCLFHRVVELFVEKAAASFKFQTQETALEGLCLLRNRRT